MLPGRIRRGLTRSAALVGVGAVGAALAFWVIPVLAGELVEQDGSGDLSADIILPVAAADRETGIPPATGRSVDRAEEDDRPHLTALTGTLVRCGNEYCVNAIKVDFGPPWYLRATEAPTDYDSDGRVESLAVDIEGLLETTVTLTVEYGRFGDADAFAINGVFYRAELGPPPWAGPPEGAGPPPWTGPPEGAGPPPWADRPEGAGPLAGLPGSGR